MFIRTIFDCNYTNTSGDQRLYAFLAELCQKRVRYSGVSLYDHSVDEIILRSFCGWDHFLHDLKYSSSSSCDQMIQWYDNPKTQYNDPLMLHQFQILDDQMISSLGFSSTYSLIKENSAVTLFKGLVKSMHDFTFLQVYE